ncbi:MAG: histidine kinase, partial [Bacteroidota bacterium]
GQPLQHTETYDALLKRYNLEVAEHDGTLIAVGSTYSPENDSLSVGLSRNGIRVVTFAPVLQSKLFPLPQILELLLDMGSWGMGTPVEIEFAVNMTGPPGKTKEFGLLQMRPLVLSREVEELNIEEFSPEQLICQSHQVLGNGAIRDIFDIVFVDPNLFDRAKSREVGREVTAFNEKLIEERRPYLLIGVGRWGSLDPWLGIPVKWDQISGARAIVEAGFKDMDVAPSQGSHFFQNITSFMVGYFTINSKVKQGFVDWAWLMQQVPLEQKQFVRHIRLDEPIIVKINGHQNKGIILKPEGRRGETT